MAQWEEAETVLCNWNRSPGSGLVQRKSLNSRGQFDLCSGRADTPSHFSLFHMFYYALEGQYVRLSVYLSTHSVYKWLDEGGKVRIYPSRECPTVVSVVFIIPYYTTISLISNKSPRVMGQQLRLSQTRVRNWRWKPLYPPPIGIDPKILILFHCSLSSELTV